MWEDEGNGQLCMNCRVIWVFYVCVSLLERERRVELIWEFRDRSQADLC
jgi:hypothetical protein